MKSPFAFFFRKKSVVPVATVTAERLGGDWYYSLMGAGVQHTVKDTDTTDGQRTAYAYCPVVTSVISKKVQAAINGMKLYVDADGNQINGNKAGELDTLLNSYGGFNNLYSVAKVMQQVFGKALIQRRRSVGFDRITSLRVLENWLVQEQPDGDYLYTAPGASITERIAREDVIVWNDQYLDFRNVFTTQNQSINGGSRLVSLRDPVSNIAAAFEGMNMIWTSGGAVGIVSQQLNQQIGNVPLTNEQRREISDNYSQKYGQQRGKSPVLVTPQPMTWQSTILPVSQLMYIEGIADNARQICDVYNISPMLLGFAAGTTFNNKEQAEKAMYQDAIIPEAQSFCDVINNDPYIGMTKQGVYLMLDYSHIDILQEGEKERADVLTAEINSYGRLYEGGLITRNQYLNALGLPEEQGSDVFINDVNKQPLALRIGTSGTQSLQAIITDTTMTPEQKMGTMIVLFGISEQEARQMLGL